MRLSTNQIDQETKKIVNGFDYENQCWIIDGIIQNCGHPENMNCKCYGRIHKGEKI